MIDESFSLYLPPGASTENPLRIMIDYEMTIFDVLKRISDYGNDFVKSLVIGEGKVEEGQALIILNGKMIEYSDLKLITAEKGSNLYIILPILGG